MYIALAPEINKLCRSIVFIQIIYILIFLFTLVVFLDGVGMMKYITNKQSVRTLVDMFFAGSDIE